MTGVVATGSTFTSGFNNTGIGTGDPVHAVSVKQLYLTLVPTRGVDVSYGGLAPIRGESTEITSYDNDAYLVGERVSVRRPREWFFDEICGHGGVPRRPRDPERLPAARPSRRGQLRADPGQQEGDVLADGVGRPDACIGACSTFPRGRSAVALHGAAAVDAIRYEQYARAGEDAAFGFAVTAEKALVPRLTVGLGYADIDPPLRRLERRPLRPGRRLFETARSAFRRSFSLAAFATQALHDDVPNSNHRRFDVVLTYNVLTTLKRAGLIR